MTPKTNEYDKALIHSLRKKLHIRTTENIELREENKTLKAEKKALKDEKKMLKAEIARITYNHRRSLRNNRNQTAEIPTQRYRRQYNPDDWT